MENKMMVMRRVLRDVSRVAEEMTRGTMTGESVDRKTVDAWAMRLCEIISRGLDIPLRNCDVANPDEQAKRFQDFCDDSQVDEDYTSVCAGCTLRTHGHCKLAWAQMPYEEGATK